MVSFHDVNGVRAFLERLRHSGRDLRALGHLKLAAIGPSTADALRAFLLEPDVVPPEFRAESLAAALRERVTGQTILYARADRGRDVLPQELGRLPRSSKSPFIRRWMPLKPTRKCWMSCAVVRLILSP